MIDLRIATTAYCTHLINVGYSKTYLINVIDKMFLEDNFTRIGSRKFNKLFLLLDGSKRRYNIIAPIASQFGSYLRKLSNGKVWRLDEIPQNARLALDNEASANDTYLYFEKSIDAKDPFSASKEIERYLSSVSAITFLSKRGIQFDWGRQMYVSRTRSGVGQVIMNDGPKFQALVPPTGRAVRSLLSQSRQILE